MGRAWAPSRQRRERNTWDVWPPLPPSRQSPQELGAEGGPAGGGDGRPKKTEKGPAARVAPGPSKERVKAGAGGCAGGGRGGQVLRWELGSGARGQNVTWLSGVRVSQVVTKRAGCLCRFMIQVVNYLLEYSAHPTEAEFPSPGTTQPGWAETSLGCRAAPRCRPQPLRLLPQPPGAPRARRLRLRPRSRRRRRPP